METTINTFKNNMQSYVSSLHREIKYLEMDNNELKNINKAILAENTNLKHYISVVEDNLEEQRCDPNDSCYYTRREFYDYYGNLELWDTLDLPFLGMYYERYDRGWKLLCSPSHHNFQFTRICLKYKGISMSDGNWYFKNEHILLDNGATIVNKRLVFES